VEPRVRVEGVSKVFRIRRNDSGSISRLFHSLARRPGKPLPRSFWALRDVSFDVEAGEVFGIIGGNGAGKSTLLKVLNGTLEPTAGDVRILGKKSALIELGAGFHPDFSGRENVFLNGLILGMTSMEVRARFDDIVSFAEIEEFIDVPVKYYSSGMYARLAFAVATAVRPEILLVDEILAVGDAAFQEKSMKRILGLREELGTAIILVSHNMGLVRSLCSRALWLENGLMRDSAAADSVVSAYELSLRHDG
jgi:ABC-type polysaccharide/polyol phosphate transport system ATPase subunit